MYVLRNKKSKRVEINQKGQKDFGKNGLALIDLDGIQDDLCRGVDPMPIMNTICGANRELVFSEYN